MKRLSIGEKIRQLRQLKGLKVNQLGRMARIPGATVSRIENGRSRQPKLESLQAIANALDVPLATLWSGDAGPLRTEQLRTSYGPEIDRSLLTSLIAAVDAAQSTRGAMWSPAMKAKCIETLYEFHISAQRRTPDVDAIERFVSAFFG